MKKNGCLQDRPRSVWRVLLQGLRLAQQFSAAELGGFFHVLVVKFAFGLAFVVAVVDGNYLVPIREVLHIRKFFGQSLPPFAAAPICVDMIFYIIFDKVKRAVLGAGEFVEALPHDAAHQFLSAGELADDT